MGDAFIVKHSSSTKLYAAIAVSYPSGSTCICSNSSKTLRAKGTSGHYIFYVPEAGTWTVSCSDGSATAARQVNISHQYQELQVILAYKLMIIENGELKQPAVLTTANYRKENDYQIIEQSANKHMYFNAGPVDLTNYSTLYFSTKQGKQELMYFGDSWGGCGFGVAANPLSSISYQVTTRLSSGYSGSTLSCDVSNLEGNYYISCDFEGSSTTTQSLYITNLWLE